MSTGELCSWTRFSLAEIVALAATAGDGGMVPPASTRISARLQHIGVQGHSSQGRECGVASKVPSAGGGGLYLPRGVRGLCTLRQRCTPRRVWDWGAHRRYTFQNSKDETQQSISNCLVLRSSLLVRNHRDVFLTTEALKQLGPGGFC